MNDKSPKVSVVTPVFNTEEYLAECIESVLAQTFSDFEYVIADNASTDKSREIAASYASHDQRIRLVSFEEHLSQIPNYNRALRQIDTATKYVKVIQADDFLYPECLKKMTAIAEGDDSIGFVSAYTLLQDNVFLDGLDYTESVLDGKEVCRRYLNDGKYLFGNPSTSLMRTSDVLSRDAFYSETSSFADADAAFRLLIANRFAHVHEVLTMVRVHENTVSSSREDMNLDALTRRVMLEKYGARVLNQDEMSRLRVRLTRRHYRVLGEGLLTFRGHSFWSFHREALDDAGVSIEPFRVLCGALVAVTRWFGNLEDISRRFYRWTVGRW